MVYCETTDMQDVICSNGTNMASCLQFWVRVHSGCLPSGIRPVCCQPAGPAVWCSCSRSTAASLQESSPSSWWHQASAELAHTVSQLLFTKKMNFSPHSVLFLKLSDYSVFCESSMSEPGLICKVTKPGAKMEQSLRTHWGHFSSDLQYIILTEYYASYFYSKVNKVFRTYSIFPQ